jgi:glycosyltransferase involved in cell wall biosynthesis
MKTILYLFHCSSIGGGSYCLLNILKNIDRTRYNPVVLLAIGGPLVDEIEKLGINVHFLNELDSVPYNLSLFKRGTLAKYRKVYGTMANYKTKIKEINPDLVYINSMMLYPYLKPTFNLGYKTVIHLREHWPLNEHRCQLRHAQKYIRKYSSHIIAINEFTSKQVPDVDSKISIVYDWIDLNERFKELPISLFFKEELIGKRMLLFTGGSAPNKGAKEIVEMFSNSLTDPSLRLLMLGNSIKTFEPTLKNRVKMFLSDKHIIEYYSYELNKLVQKDKRIVCASNIYEIRHLLDQCYCLISFFTIAHANLAMAECIVNNTVSLAAETEESLEYSANGRLAFLCEMNNKESFIETFHRLEKEYDLMKDNLKKESYMIRDRFDKFTNVDILNNVYDKLLY